MEGLDYPNGPEIRGTCFMREKRHGPREEEPKKMDTETAVM
jgi:hypothetical protein